MKKYYKATITYTMDKKHPDFNVTDWGKFNSEKMKHFVAGGGYDWKHIHHVQISIHEIPRENREKETREIEKLEGFASELAETFIKAFAD